MTVTFQAPLKCISSFIIALIEILSSKFDRGDLKEQNLLLRISIKAVMKEEIHFKVAI
jgi:hypothetical protein